MKTLTEEQVKKIVQVLEHVETMRGLQVKYFKDRLQGDLNRSKMWERQVDTEVDKLLRVLKGEPIVEKGKLL